MATKKEQTTEVIKEPRTVKVSSVVISVLVLAAILASFITGWFMHGADQDRVRQEAAHIVQLSKEQK